MLHQSVLQLLVVRFGTLCPLPVLIEKLSSQQTTRIIGDAPQPLFRSHLLFAVEGLRIIRLSDPAGAVSRWL